MSSSTRSSCLCSPTSCKVQGWEGVGQGLEEMGLGVVRGGRLGVRRVLGLSVRRGGTGIRNKWGWDLE